MVLVRLDKYYFGMGSSGDDCVYPVVRIYEEGSGV